MPTIRIDDEVWGALKKKAVPLEDTPNHVLRRLLGIDPEELPSAATPAGRSAAPERWPRKASRQTPHQGYRLPILRALVAMGGSGEVSKVMQRVAEEMKHSLTPWDRQDISSGMVRWEKAANWERFEMVREGLVKADSPRGLWEVSDKGRRYLTEHGQGIPAAGPHPSMRRR